MKNVMDIQQTIQNKVAIRRCVMKIENSPNACGYIEKCKDGYNCANPSSQLYEKHWVRCSCANGFCMDKEEKQWQK